MLGVCRKYETPCTSLRVRVHVYCIRTVSIEKSRRAYTRIRVTGVPRQTRPVHGEKSTATSTVKPLIIGLVSHKSSDRALSRNVAPLPCTTAAENFFTSRNCDSLAPPFHRIGRFPCGNRRLSTPLAVLLHFISFYFARPIVPRHVALRRLVRRRIRIRKGGLVASRFARSRYLQGWLPRRRFSFQLSQRFEAARRGDLQGGEYLREKLGTENDEAALWERRILLSLSLF